MTVVYVDSVFVLNALMDYLLLLSTARLAGVPLKRLRYLLAALAGGGYAVAVFLPGCAFLAQTPVKLAFGVVMALIAFGGEEKLLRLTLLLLAVSCAMAGCVLALGLISGGAVPVVNGIFYTDVDVKVLVIAATAAYIVLQVVFRAAARRGMRGELVPVRICIGGRIVELTALLDTGNTLRDPASGRPVLVAARGSLDGCLSPQARRLLSSGKSPAELLEPLSRLAPELHLRLIPYHAVGVQGGLLLMLRSDWAEIGGEQYPGLPAALAPTALGNGYSALWGGEIRRGGRYGQFDCKMPSAAGASGAAGGCGHSLHWRQRYPSAAADPGAGGGAAGAPGGGERPQGAH